MPQSLAIHLGQSDPLILRFKFLNNPIAELWADRMQQRSSWLMDHPDRFYGFGTPKQELQRAQEQIQQCIDTINSHEFIITRPFGFNQDCLNYLHNIFERYHGLLDQQNSDFWEQAPVPVREALAELNLNVHRCESVMSRNPPRFVCTWFSMPKTHTLSTLLQGQYGTMQVKFGTVYLNYVEIGKTLEDLAHDQDEYIGDDAFLPFDHYSADFRVAFYDQDLSEKIPAMTSYYQEHHNFFVAKGITSVYNVQALPLRFPVAELEHTLDRNNLLNQISNRQYITQVTLE